MRFRFVEDRRADYPVKIMCDVLDVSRAGYYAWRKRQESQRSATNRALLDDIKRVHRDSHGCYGSPRVHLELKAQGRGASRGRIERLMRGHGIRAIMARPRRVRTTDSRHDLPIAPKPAIHMSCDCRPILVRHGHPLWLAIGRASAIESVRSVVEQGSMEGPLQLIDQVARKLPKETVVGDYLQSNQFGITPPADRAYLDAGFEAVRNEYRTFSRYLVKGLGLDERTYQQLRRRLVE